MLQWPRECTFKCWGGAITCLSGEWLLTREKRPNGGEVIVQRALWVACWLYLIGISLRWVLDPNGLWNLDGGRLVADMRESIPWFGTAFAAAYAALYARFASQWHYLASLYNQIKQTEIRVANQTDQITLGKMAQWKAGFIEDAEELHLATKGIFSSVIKAWGDEDAVQEQYEEHTPGGAERLERLLKRVRRVCDDQRNRLNSSAAE